jgi:hypothetical protein
MDKPTICSALIVADDSIPYRELYKWCYAKALEYAEYLSNRDQGIINLALQEFKITPNMISSYTWQCKFFKETVHTAKIVHFGYKVKPWDSEVLIMHFPEWYRTHLAWIKLGGSDFPKHATMNLFNMLTIEDIYKPLNFKRIIKYMLVLFINALTLLITQFIFFKFLNK